MTVSDHPISNFNSMTELLGCLWQCIVRWNDVHNRLAVAAFGEQNLSVNQSENCVVFAEAYVFACRIFCAALTNKYVTSENNLTAVTLNAKTTTC